jgi:hypothetical protein
MLEIIAIVALSVFAFMLAKRLFRRRGAAAGARSETAVELWAKSEVARLLADKLQLEEPDVSAALGGNPDPEVVSRLERAVKKVEVVYERVPGLATAADVRVEVSLESGRLERSVRRIEWTELPAHVKDEFASTGTAHVFRPFLFPWQS